ncbi:VOC family protein [Actinopolymorpha pittospori]
MPALFRATVIDCPEPPKLADFYRELLGWRLAQRAPDWCVLTNDDGIRLSFQQVADYQPPDWPDPDRPQQVHLDFAVDDEDDLERVERRVLELGGTRLPEPPDRPGRLRIYADPAGHPFCLIPGAWPAHDHDD